MGSFDPWSSALASRCALMRSDSLNATEDADNDQRRNEDYEQALHRERVGCGHERAGHCGTAARPALTSPITIATLGSELPLRVVATLSSMPRR